MRTNCAFPTYMQILWKSTSKRRHSMKYHENHRNPTRNIMNIHNIPSQSREFLTSRAARQPASWQPRQQLESSRCFYKGGRSPLMCSRFGNFVTPDPCKTNQNQLNLWIPCKFMKTEAPTSQPASQPAPSPAQPASQPSKPSKPS